MAVKPPTVKKKTGPVTYNWKDHALDGVDVRLRRCTGKKRPGVPAADPSYVFRENMVREFAWATWPHDDGPWTPCLLSGPKGSGKTSFVEQIAARCNVPVFRTNLNVGTTVRHLKGRQGAEAGRTVFIPGIVTMAMEQGAWLLLDELSGVTPPVALSLFPVLEPDGKVLLEDAQPPRYVRRHPDFRIFCTDNTIGAAQEEARFSYTGTNPDLNEALLDRIGSLIEVGYLEPELEHKAVAAKIPTIEATDLACMINVASAVRGSDEIGGGFSTRMLVEWARRAASGSIDARGVIHRPDPEDDSYILDAARSGFLNKMKSTVERDALIEVIRREFDIAMPHNQ